MNRARQRHLEGFTAVELLVAMALATTVLLFAGAYLQRLYKRYKILSAVREVNSLVLATRMEAVKGNTNAVLFVDVANRRIVSWRENLPYNFVQDPGERVTHQYMLPGYVYFWRSEEDGDMDPDDDAVRFDKYNGDSSLVDRVVFRGDGTLIEPEKSNSKRPEKILPPYTPNVPYMSVTCDDDDDCRGIYLADRMPTDDDDFEDWAGNVFRISVDELTPSGKVSLLKWLPNPEDDDDVEESFVPPPWQWFD